MTEPARFHHVLLDTGPLVALRNPADSRHMQAVETLQRIEPPLLTCWPVITEAAWMLRHDASLVRRLLQSMAKGAFAILSIQADEIADIDSLYGTYADLAPQLADIALLYLAQREQLEAVFSLIAATLACSALKARKDCTSCLTNPELSKPERRPLTAPNSTRTPAA